MQECDSKYREICFNRAFVITQSRKSCIGLLQGVLFTRDNVDIGRIYGGRERESEKKKKPSLVGLGK